ncbi:tetratricopeptide repeat protein [Flavobacterium sp. H122]|uniref:tetratricopeptide repeat protein n=1 Tax=Flavobacterium sp. H122 TaxID=2529860 RepID=UPI0010AA67A2|nr:tetratricopeptide repeat protein [Flavobacterium sp. H122]
MNLSEFSQLLNNPNTVLPTQITELNSILKVYPYFQSARSLYLKGLQKHDSIKYNTSLRKTAAYTTDRTVLFDLITSEHFETVNNKALAKAETVKTEEIKVSEIIPTETAQEPVIENKLEQSLLNSIEIADSEEKKPIESSSTDFRSPLEQSIISSIGAANTVTEEEKQLADKESIKKEEQQQLEKTVTEMISWLEDKIEDEDEKPISFNKSETHSFQEWLQLSKLKPIERENSEENSAENNSSEPKKEIVEKMKLIDKFIENNPKIAPPKENIPVPEYIIKKEETSYLMTETLAKIYLEQKKYSKAIQAYEILILKYPEKSSLFADRILDIKDLQQNNNK